METGQLPTPRRGLRAAVVDNILYVTGGDVGDYNNPLHSILSWNPSTETWQPAGALSVKRFQHAAVAVLSVILKSECF